MSRSVSSLLVTRSSSRCASVFGALLLLAGCGRLADIPDGPPPVIDTPPVVDPPVVPGTPRPDPDPVVGLPPSPVPPMPSPEVLPPTSDDPSGARPSFTGALGSTCQQAFPPPAMMRCEVQETATLRYVSPSGSDAHDGTAPGKAWKTLAHAVSAAPAGATLRVATGEYTSARIRVQKPLVVRGGWSSTFATWDPDAYPSIAYGALSIADDDAVWSGFRMISRYDGKLGDFFSESRHMVTRGALVGNYFETVFRPSADQHHLYGIIAAAEEGHRTRLACNDVYARVEGRAGVGASAIQLGNHALHDGVAEISRNRVCVDERETGWYTKAVDGYGSCGAAPASVILTNNVLESRGGRSTGVYFYSCKSALDLVLTNNTILTDRDAVGGSASRVPLRLRMVNNLLFARRGGGRAVALGGADASILESSGNLVLGGFAVRTPSPTPLQGSGDDLGASATLGSVLSADLSPVPGGLADGLGTNVYGQPESGDVRVDLDGQPRSTTDGWSRGARQ